MKSILVTGGAGFVGSSLALGFRQRLDGARVIALDNLRRRGSELNLARLRDGGVEFLHGDIRNPEDLAAAGPFGLLLECSAEPSVLAGYGGDPAYVVNTNLLGTVHCLDAARRHGSGVLFLSTSRVYPIAAINALHYLETNTRFELDDEQPLPGAGPAGLTERFPLEGARSLYGATKLASELLLEEYRAMYGLRAVINRCGVIAGPWQMGRADQGVAVLWAARHHYGGALEYIGYGGAGKQVRDLLHIDDLVELVWRQAQHLDQLDGQLFNVGGGRPVSLSLLELTALCRAATGKTIPIGSRADDRVGDIRLYLTDNAKITGATGWRPQRSAEDIIGDIVRWIRDNEAPLRPILS